MINLDQIERAAAKDNGPMGQFCFYLLSEVRRLQHELNDPNYQYFGRIHRQAILVRNAQIEKLELELKKAKEINDHTNQST